MAKLNFDENERHYSYDAVTAEFRFSDTTVDANDENQREQWWDAQPTVNSSEVPSYYNDFFETDSYFKIPTVVAKSVPQTYWIDGDEYTFLKPPEELKKATWSLDGKPYTVKHPSSGAVRSTDEIHGFWGQPRYEADEEESWATLYFPTNDDEARTFVAENDNVSVGFINSLVRDDEHDNIDAQQTNIYYDHVASVESGRCSDEDGCGLQSGTFTPDASGQKYLPASSIPLNKVETPISITEMNVDGVDGSNTNDNTTNDTMTCDCGQTDGGKDTTMNFDVDDFSVQKIRAENDAVDEKIVSQEQQIDELKSEVDSLETNKELFSAVAERVVGDDEDADGQDIIEALDALQDEHETLQDSLDEYRTEDRDDLLDAVKEMTDSENHERFAQGDDESVVAHITRLEDALETMKMVKGDTSVTAATTGSRTMVDDDSERERSNVSQVGATVDTSKFADVAF